MAAVPFLQLAILGVAEYRKWERWPIVAEVFVAPPTTHIHTLFIVLHTISSDLCLSYVLKRKISNPFRAINNDAVSLFP